MAHIRHLTTPARLLATVAAAVTLGLAGGVSPAGAHVEPQTAEVTAGSPAEIALTVQHGCDGSPTVKLEIQTPPAVEDLQPVDKDGWAGSVAGDVVTFTGGPLPDDVEDQFAVRFTAPDEPGTLRFKMIQTCESGTIDWIQEEDGAERPAPVVQVVAAAPGATTVPAETPTTAAPPATTSTIRTTTTTEAVGRDGETGTDDAPAAELPDEGGSAVPWLVAGAVVLVGAGGAYLWTRRTP